MKKVLYLLIFIVCFTSVKVNGQAISVLSDYALEQLIITTYPCYDWNNDGIIDINEAAGGCEPNMVLVFDDSMPASIDFAGFEKFNIDNLTLRSNTSSGTGTQGYNMDLSKLGRGFLQNPSYYLNKLRLEKFYFPNFDFTNASYINILEFINCGPTMDFSTLHLAKNSLKNLTIDNTNAVGGTLQNLNLSRPNLETVSITNFTIQQTLDFTNSDSLLSVYLYDVNNVQNINLPTTSVLKYLSIETLYQNFNLNALNLINQTELLSLTMVSNASNTTLNNLDLTHNTKLTFLKLSNLDNIISFDLSQNGLLETIEITDFNGFTNLSTLDFSNQSYLQTLKVSNNQLNAINLTGNTLLTTLDCSFNNLSVLDLISCSGIKFLDCSNNDLSSITFSGATSVLETVDISSNLFNLLDFSSDTNLYKITCNDMLLLEGLNIANGNNANMNVWDTTGLFANNTPKLKCVTIDNNIINNIPQNWFIDSGTSYSAISDEITVPDTNFYQALLNNPERIDKDFNGKISYCEANSFTGIINVSNKNISDLTGIDNFILATGLDCSNNNLTTVDLSINTELITIKCNYNSLSYVPTTNNTKLVHFECNNNNVFSLNLSTNTLLEYLDCSKNQLSTLNTTVNTALKTLNFSNNNLTAFNGSTLSNLLTCYANNNALTSLDVSNSSLMTELNCSFNQLTGLNTTYFTNLQNFYCSDNQLQSLSVSGSSNLKILDCSNNLFTSAIAVTINLTNNNALERLICKNNQLEELDLSNASSLVQLDASNNALTSLNMANGNNNNISTQNFNTLNNPNLYCIQVSDVNYVNTNWTQIDPNTVFSLNCGGVQLTNIPDLAFESYLETHDVNGNVVPLGDPNSLGNGSLTDHLVPTPKIQAVTSLNISNQSIQNITGINDFINLANLNISNNNLNGLSININTLTTLNANNTTLTSIDINNCNNLTTLFCTGNQLGNLDISNLNNLSILYCYNNSLTSINFNLLVNLTEFNAASNQLTSLDFSAQNNLTLFLCNDNQLSYLNVQNGTNQNITTTNFNITNNNLSCVMVDNVNYSNTNWTNKDAQTQYDIYCPGGNTAKIWENGAWTNGAPTINDEATINDTYNTQQNGNFECYTLTVNTGKTLTVSPNTEIVIDTDIINNGSILVETTGSVVQIDDLANCTGNGIYNVSIKTTSLADQSRYTYFCSPVQNETLNAFASWANISNMYSFNENTNVWVTETTSANINGATGYAIAPSVNNSFPFVATTQFTGKFNNGTFTRPLVYTNNSIDDDDTLVGNPYPCAIDAALLLNNNPGANAFYFWTHQSAYVNGSYVSDDYSVWNNLGGIGSASGASAPTGYIASGQGFFVQANANANTGTNNIFEITNSVKAPPGSNTNFIRSNQDNNDEQDDKIWINLTTDQGFFSQLLIGFIPQGTAGFDPSYDAYRMESGAVISYYSIGLNGEHYAIEARSVLNGEQIVPLGITVNQSNTQNFTLSIDHFENFVDATIFVKNKLSGQLHDLRQADFNFTLQGTGAFEDRYELIFNRNSLSVSDNQNENTSLLVRNTQDNQILITTNNKKRIKQIRIYDILGKTLLNKKVNTTNVEAKLNVKTGTVLFIQAVLDNNYILTGKIIIK